MTYRNPEHDRVTQRNMRGPELERQMIERATQLIAERARKTGVSPTKLINQIFPHEPEPAKSKQRVADDDIAAMLIKRLAARDEMGGGSGAPG